MKIIEKYVGTDLSNVFFISKFEMLQQMRRPHDHMFALLTLCSIFIGRS